LNCIQIRERDPDFGCESIKQKNILASERYKVKDGCTNGIESVKKNAPDALQ
jgi:hypothetical protein